MMLGSMYLATYVGVALIGSFLIGLIGNRLQRDETRPVTNFDAIVDRVEEEDEHHIPAPEGGSRLGRLMHWAFWDLGADISVDMAIGLTVAALVLAFLPIELTEAYLGTRSIWPLLLVILLGIPVYTCSVPTIPIVWALFMRGAMPGAMLALSLIHI